MNLAGIGSGGREHSICYKLKQATKIKNLICIPGNAGTKKIAKNINVNILDFDEVYRIIKNHNIDILIISANVHGINHFFHRPWCKCIMLLRPVDADFGYSFKKIKFDFVVFSNGFPILFPIHIILLFSITI